MLKELIDFVDSILPSVPLDTKEGVQDAIAQFEKEGHQIKYLMAKPLSKLSQGDIISNIPFRYYMDNGKQREFVSNALVLSTSCHIDQKDKLVLVPVLPLDVYKGNMIDLKKNKVIDFMYIPDGVMEELFVDFEIMNTFSKNLFMSGIKNKKQNVIASLNQVGYYFFIIKLTVYLMRREDIGTLEERNENRYKSIFDEFKKT